MTRAKLIVVAATWGAESFRRCRRAEHVRHGFNYVGCDCLRLQVPRRHRAKSSGVLAVPEAQHAR